MSFLHSLESSIHDAAASAIKKHGSQILDKAKEIAMDQGKEYIKKKFGGEAEESGEEKTGAEATTTAQDSEKVSIKDRVNEINSKGEKKEENSYDEMKRSHHHHHHERHSNQNESTQSYEDNYTETNYQTNQQYNVNVKERVGEINSQKSYQSYVPQSQTAPQSQSSSNGQSGEQGAKPQTSSTTSTASANNASQDNHPLSASQTKPAVPASKPDPTSSLLDLEIKAVQALTGQKDDKPGTAQTGGKEPEKTNTTKDAIIGLVTSQMKTNEQLKLFNQTLLKDEAKEEKNLKAATDKGMLVDEFEISFQRDLQQQKGCFAATLEKILSLLNSK